MKYRVGRKRIPLGDINVYYEKRWLDLPKNVCRCRLTGFSIISQRETVYFSWNEYRFSMGTQYRPMILRVSDFLKTLS